MKEINIDEKLAGQKMMRCLERYLSNAPKSFLYKMLRKKNITLNNSKATGDEKLKCGDTIKIFFSDETFEKFSADNNRAVNDDYYSRIYRPLDIIYENSDVIFINKPSGMLSQKAKPEDVSLVEYLIAHLIHEKKINAGDLASFKPGICNDNDIVVLYDYANHLKVEERLKKYGFSISFGVEDGQGIMSEVGHMYRNGIKNIRFIDGRDNMLTISREEIATYDMFFKDEYVTNPALQNALISFFQEFRKDKVDDNSPVLASKETDLKVALRNADLMVPCTKEEKDDSVSIAHPYVDITDKVEHKEGEQVLALPVFTDGIELDKCYFDKHENMLYTYMELLKSVKEIGASGIVINPLGVSYYVPLDIMKKIIAD